ncbi:MAG: hypothetical protein ACRC46_14050 [Thermoguttaceae bacterium]
MNVQKIGFIFVAVFACATTFADEPNVPLVPVPLTAAEHLWGGFEPGATIRTHTVTKMWQGNDVIRSTAENQVVLDAVDEQGVTLKVFTMVGLAARRYKAPPTIQRLDFFQQPLKEENLTYEDLPATTVEIAGRTLDCQLRRYKRIHSRWRQETLVYYTPLVYPYILRTETTRWSLPTDKQPAETVTSRTVTRVVETAAVASSRRNLGTFTMETVKQQGETTTTGVLKCLLSVPGGVISESIYERDKSGRVVREVETVLKGYSGTRELPSSGTSPLEPHRGEKIGDEPLLPPESE